MALNLVTLNWDITDLVQAGQQATLVIAPTAQLSDSADHVLVPTIPRQVMFYGSGSLAGIVANDNSAITPSGTGYYISVITAGGQVIVPQMQVQILFSNGATQWLDALAPVPSVTTTYQYLPLPSGTPSSGQVPVATGAGETSAWGNVLANPMTTLGDTLYENAAPAATRLPGNTTSTKKFLTQTGTGSVSAAPGWNTIAAADMPAGTTSAQGALQLDGTAGDIQPTGAQAAGATGKAADAGHVHPQTGLVTSVAATDTSIVVGGTSAAPTIATGTLDVIAADHPPAANWSNNSKKITSLANGSAASDAAAFGQIPVIDATTGDIAAAPGTAAAGATGKAADAGHVHPQPPVLAPTGLTGATAASRYTGAVASGAPASGTFAVGDYTIDQTGSVWVCTAAGTPGTWKQVITPAITAADTSAVVGGTAAAPTIRTGTLDVIATQHPAAADWSNNSHKITSLANGSGAQDAAAFGQIPLADSTAANILPDGVQAAGANGKWADSGHVHQNNADLSIYMAPSGATGEAFPRQYGQAYLVLVSQTVYYSAIPLPKGLAVNNLSAFVGSQAAAATPTHGWYALLDNNLVVRAVSADQTSAWASTFSKVTLSVSGSAYTTTYGGLYYFAVCITSATTMPNLVAAVASLGGATGYAPILCGTGSTTSTTPPTTGTTLTAATHVAADRIYNFTS